MARPHRCAHIDHSFMRLPSTMTWIYIAPTFLRATGLDSLEFGIKLCFCSKG